MTFPLPLVPFEKYMLADGSAAYPRAFVVVVELAGELSRPALEAAWPAALARHPLLRAVIDHSAGSPRWLEIRDAPLPIDWAEQPEPLRFTQGELIDIAHEPGVRLWVRTGPDEAQLTLQFHHACCDGVGGLQFIGDLLAAYAHEVTPGSPGPAWQPVDADLLKQRGTFGLTKPTLREALRDTWIGLREGLRLTLRRPLPVQLPAASGTAAASTTYPGIERYTFSPSELADLRSTAKAAGASLNDLLMCYLYQALAQWNTTQAGSEPRGWLRMNVPTNLRRREDEQMPAANVMSFTFLDRHTRDCHDTPALLESIRAEMELIKRYRLGLYFIGQLAFVCGLPGGLSLMLSGKRCLATAVLTNVGDPSRRFNARFPRREGELQVGNLTLKNVLGSPPLRPLTRAGVAITTYAGKLTVSLQCDAHHFSGEQTRQLLATYIAHIRRGLSHSALQRAAEPGPGSLPVADVAAMGLAASQSSTVSGSGTTGW